MQLHWFHFKNNRIHIWKVSPHLKISLFFFGMANIRRHTVTQFYSHVFKTSSLIWNYKLRDILLLAAFVILFHSIWEQFQILQSVRLFLSFKYYLRISKVNVGQIRQKFGRLCFLHTGLFINPSGISELDCAITKTDTAERSISIGRESLQVFFVLGALTYFQVPPLGGSREENGVHSE